MKKGMLLSALTVILVAAMVGVGSFAWFTSSAESSGNIFTAGTLEIEIVEPVDGPVFAVSNKEPGDSVTERITVRNAGSIDMQFRAVVSGTSWGGNGVDLADKLNVVATLVDVSGSSKSDVVYEGTLANLIAYPDQMKMWTARPFSSGMTATFEFVLTFDKDADNDYQGAGWEGDITFYADQWTNPTPLPRGGLALWLDARQGVSAGEDGRVSYWADQSGKGNHATQQTAAFMPELRRGSINGSPSLYFDGTTRMDTNLLSLGSDYTIIAVTKRTANNDCSFIGGGSGRTLEFLTSGRLRMRNGGTSATWHGVIGINSWHSFALSSNGHDVLTLFVDGTDRGQVVSEDVAGAPFSFNGIGYRGDGYRMFTGEIAELLVYERELTSAEREEVHEYLNRKYQIY